MADEEKNTPEAPAAPELEAESVMDATEPIAEAEAPVEQASEEGAPAAPEAVTTSAALSGDRGASEVREEGW